MSRCTCFAVPGLPGAAHLSGCPLYDNPAPIDWPDRVRVAMNAAYALEANDLAGVLDDLGAELYDLPPDVVDAIGQALLGRPE
jgi:hypothetical protein